MPPTHTPRSLSADLTQQGFTYSFSDNSDTTNPPNTPATMYSLSPPAPRTGRMRGISALQEVMFEESHVEEQREPESNSTSSDQQPLGIDLRALTYVSHVDENLACPICRMPLVDPVDTECDHTFCRDCITQALSHQEICPIDRSPASITGLSRSHKLITNQLDSLLVKCPCCEESIPRVTVLYHVEKYCRDGLIQCSSSTCEKYVKRSLYDVGCLHYPSTCPDCGDTVQQIDLGNHRENVCELRKMECGYCGTTILRCQSSEHLEDCSEFVTACKWAKYGCLHMSRRKDMPMHTDECTMKLMGPLAAKMEEEIKTLRAEVQTLNEKDHHRERRIRFLEGASGEASRPLEWSDLTSHMSSSESPEAVKEYLLSLIENLATRQDQLSTEVQEQIAKMTVMMFDQLLPIKTDLGELRSQNQVASMHIRWLMNFRRQENQRRPGGGAGGGSGPGSSGGSDAGGSGDSPLPRRLSDSVTRDLITKL